MQSSVPPVLFLIILLTAAVSLISCTQHQTAESKQHQAEPQQSSVAPAGPRLIGGESSAEAVVRAALDALAERDTARLERLVVHADEFMQHVYPEYGIHYGAARDTSRHARQFIWQMHSLNSDKGLKKGLAKAGGKKMELVSVDFTDSMRQFDTYTLHEGTHVRVRMEDGKEGELDMIGSIIEMDGHYKLLSYRSRD